MKKMIAVVSLALLFSPLSLLNAQRGPGWDDEGMGPGYGIGMHEGMGPEYGREGMRPEKGMRMGKRGGKRGRFAGKKGIMKRKGMRGGFFSEEETLKLVKKYDPSFYSEIKGLKSESPRKYRFVLKLASGLLAGTRKAGDPELEKEAIEGLRLEYECRELSKKYKEASDKEKEEIKNQIKNKTSRLFDIRERARKTRVEMMEKNLKEMKKKLADRKAHKKEIVENRINQLLGEGYRW